jgi:hypothetical protein
MGGIKKFRSFKRARESYFSEMQAKGFDPLKMQGFLEEYTGWIKNPYKPGIYKFKSFKEARNFDLQQIIKTSTKKGT